MTTATHKLSASAAVGFGAVTYYLECHGFISPALSYVQPTLDSLELNLVHRALSSPTMMRRVKVKEQFYSPGLLFIQSPLGVLDADTQSLILKESDDESNVSKPLVLLKPQLEDFNEHADIATTINRAVAESMKVDDGNTISSMLLFVSSIARSARCMISFQNKASRRNSQVALLPRDYPPCILWVDLCEAQHLTENEDRLKHFREVLKELRQPESSAVETGKMLANDIDEVRSTEFQNSSHPPDNGTTESSDDLDSTMHQTMDDIPAGENIQVLVNSSGFLNWHLLDVSSAQTSKESKKSSLLFLGASELPKYDNYGVITETGVDMTIDEETKAVNEWVTHLTGGRSAYLEDLYGMSHQEAAHDLANRCRDFENKFIGKLKEHFESEAFEEPATSWQVLSLIAFPDTDEPGTQESSKCPGVANIRDILLTVSGCAEDSRLFQGEVEDIMVAIQELLRQGFLEMIPSLESNCIMLPALSALEESSILTEDINAPNFVLSIPPPVSMALQRLVSDDSGDFAEYIRLRMEWTYNVKDMSKLADDSNLLLAEYNAHNERWSDVARIRHTLTEAEKDYLDFELQAQENAFLLQCNVMASRRNHIMQDRESLLKARGERKPSENNDEEVAEALISRDILAKTAARTEEFKRAKDDVQGSPQMSSLSKYISRFWARIVK